MADTGTRNEPDRLRIRFAPNSPKASVTDAKVELVKILDDGTEGVTDISRFVRAADIRLHLNEAATAILELYVSDVETETLISEIQMLRVKPPRWWKRKRMIEVSVFDATGAKQYLPGSGLR